MSNVKICVHSQMFKLNHHQAEDSLWAATGGRAVLCRSTDEIPQRVNKMIGTSTQNGQVQTVCRGGAGGSMLSTALWFPLACMFDVKR